MQERKQINKKLKDIGVFIQSPVLNCFLIIATSEKVYTVKSLSEKMQISKSCCSVYLRILNSCDLITRKNKGKIYIGKTGEDIIHFTIGEKE